MNRELLKTNIKIFLALTLTFILILSIMAPTVKATAIYDDTQEETYIDPGEEEGIEEKIAEFKEQVKDYENKNNITGNIIDFSNLKNFDFKNQTNKTISSYVKDCDGWYSISKNGSDYTIKLSNLTAKKIILPADDADIENLPEGDDIAYTKQPRKTHITIELEGTNKVTGYGIKGYPVKGITIKGTGSLTVNAFSEPKVEKVSRYTNGKWGERKAELTYEIKTGISVETETINTEDEKTGFIFRSGVNVTINNSEYWGIICNGDIKFESGCIVTLNTKTNKKLQSGAISADKIITEKDAKVTISGGEVLEHNKNQSIIPEKQVELKPTDTEAPVILAKGIEQGKAYCLNPEITVTDNKEIATVTVNGIIMGKSFTRNSWTEKVFTIPSRYMKDGNENVIVATDAVGNQTIFKFTWYNMHKFGNWITKGNKQERICSLCGEKETKNIEIEEPNLYSTDVSSVMDKAPSNSTIEKPSVKNNVITASNITKSYSKSARSFSINANQIGNGKLTYSSNNKSVTVSSSGKITVKSKFIGKATITIKASNTPQYKAAIKKITITVNPPTVKLSKLTNAKGKKMTVKWSKNNEVTGYQIQYSTSKNFKKDVKTITVNKKATVSKIVTKLSKNKTYYVRIRSYKTVAKQKIYSNWSAIKHLKIKK